MNSELKFNVGGWQEEEHLRFVEAIRAYGKNWFEVAGHVKTRDKS